ncbi:Zinc finger Transcription Factor family member (ztf-7) [Trypanosoma conorhini]|uniref:Zinc finger Transcription Factor family member (Ztf-7) n=1 Tax=Trypanosoma conorhini TaxID=83891 RepID=A0A3R7NE36_9TRYP|nr:Zinc finger Transcription Factor family member (ztf-7) [Trypanosoma conorhini]RNF05100.1 Zinc finger Transcription Factor family member (ztf-7) [Trypanosoma conorhini]
MSDLTTLRASCKAILARHQRGLTLELSCILCRQRVRGQQSAMQHYADAHGIHPTNHDNIVDLDGFLAHLRGLLFLRDDERMHCPVCRAACGEEASLMAHIAEEGHSRWDTGTIPTLAPFCITGDNVKEEDGDGDEDEDEAENAGGNNAAEDEDEDDGGEDWGIEPAVCLLCETESEDCLRHMIDAHGFDFRAAVQAHAGVHEVYDLIRIVNIIRKCVAQGICPFNYRDESADVEACRCSIAASSLEEHLREHPLHALPRVLSSDDRELIPVLCGDAFISSVVVGGDLLAQQEEDPDYPMVPTIAEMAKKQAEGRQAKGIS